MAKLSTEEVEAKLSEEVENFFGDGARIENLTRLTGGASQETWSFDVVTADNGRHSLILRRDTPAATHGIPRLTEYELLRAAGAAGVPVPRPLFFISKESGLGPAYVMDRIEGETIPRKILRDEPYKKVLPDLAAQCGEALAHIHEVPLENVKGLVVPRAGENPAKLQLTAQRMVYESLGEVHPAFELGFRWLEERLPKPGRITLVHGDFRNGNLIINEKGVQAVLDWELAHVGDPMEDLGWLCVKSWRFGVSQNPVGGFGARSDLFEAYEEASGLKVDKRAVHFWEVFGNLKWGIICMLQASYHLSGKRRSVELAALGRRVCEMEWDLLEMLD